MRRTAPIAVALAAAAAVFLISASASEAAAQVPTPPAGAAKTSDSALKVPPYRFRFLGVYDDDSGEPMVDVEVASVLTGVSSRTSKTGTVSLFFLPDGGGLVRIRKPGYEVQTFPVSISEADTTPVTVSLKKAVTLPTVEVKDAAPVYLSPRLRGAVERMHAGQGGYFIDEATMRKNDGSTLANTLVGHVAGILETYGKHGEQYFVSSRTPCKNAMISCRAPTCFVKTFIDGVESAVTVDFAHEQPDTYAIAEFYPGGAAVPPEFGRDGGPCGVLLLWTRER